MHFEGNGGDAGSAYGGQAKRAGVDIAHTCHPDLALPIYGTLGSATMIVAADDFQAAHISVANDALEHVRGGVGYPAGASESGGAQGVAWMALRRSSFRTGLVRKSSMPAAKHSSRSCVEAFAVMATMRGR